MTRVCTVSNGSGTVAEAAVANVAVSSGAPAARFAYVANTNVNSVSAYIIDPTSGALNPIAGPTVVTGINPEAITVDPTGRFAYAANYASDYASAYTIDATSGALSPLAAVPTVAARSGPRAMVPSR